MTTKRHRRRNPPRPPRRPRPEPVDDPTGEPILIRCEGSGCPPAAMYDGLTIGSGMCAMCGHPVSVVSGAVLDHQRDDIIARLRRGDFG